MPHSRLRLAAAAPPCCGARPAGVRRPGVGPRRPGSYRLLLSSRRWPAATSSCSICPPEAAEDTAGQVAGHGYRGLYLDANAISPHRAVRIAETVTTAGVGFVDGSIIGPPPSEQTGPRLYLSGDHTAAATISAIFTGTSVETTILDDRVGTASALKMAFGSYQKGARTLAAVSHALAAAYGLTEALTNEGKRMASPILADLDYLPSVAARAWRWAPELTEAAQTLHQLDLPPDLAQATAAVLRRWDADRDQFDLSVPEVLHHLRTH